MKHMAQFGWISRTQKTVKTECAKHVSVSKIAIETDTDCPACRAAVDKTCNALIQVAEQAASIGVDAKTIADARSAASNPKRYQSVYIL